MADEKTPQAPPKKPDDRAGSASLIDILAEEDQADKKVFRIAIIGAVVFHLILFVANLPSFGAQSSDAQRKKPKIYVVKQVKFQPPPKPEIPPVPKPKTKKVPIPDPTPDEPEPIREDEPQEDIDFIPDDNLVLGVPDAPPPPEPEGPVRFVVGGDITEPKRTSGPNPRYPETARRARIEGAVILELVIDKQGNPQNIKVLRGLPLGLTEAAVEAVKKWQFKPATRQGKPVEVIYVLTVTFKLQ